MKELSSNYILSLSSEQIETILDFIKKCEQEDVLEQNHPLLRVQIQFLEGVRK